MPFAEKNISKLATGSVTLNPDCAVISRAERGSLSETQYFVHLSRRLGYLSDADAERLIGQTRQTFACLHGLIKAVEREAGKFNKMIATVTSLLVLGMARWSSSL